MLQGSRFNRFLGRLLAVALALACLFPATVAAKAGSANHEPLAPSLATLAEPAVAAKPPAQQARILGLPSDGPGSLLRRGNRLLVKVRFDHGALASRGAIAETGGEVLNDSRRYQLATVAVVPAELESLAAVPTVAAVTPERTPKLYAAGCEGGSVISEGVAQLGVDDAREVFPLRGRGITVGVLSDSFNVATKAIPGGAIATHAAQDILSNDIPGLAGTCSDQQLPVRVLEEGPPGESADEGRAMLQIVHDIAPHASLAFATAFSGELAFAENIERLARPVSAGGAGADVIVDDVGYFEEPFFQDGPVAAAINKVTSEGVNYLTAAGNENIFDEAGNEIASWEAPAYRDAGSCPTAVASLPLKFNPSHCMDFDPSGPTDTTFGIRVEPGETLTIDLQWAEPWNGVTDDLDAFLLSESGELLTGTVNLTNAIETQTPVEIVGRKNNSAAPKTFQLVVNRRLGVANPRLKFITMLDGPEFGETEYPESNGGDVVGPTIYGHAGAASAISVAAIPFNSTTEPEEYSSRGPVTHYFAPVEGALPAAPLLTPEELEKPDVTATDCGATTFFASKVGGVWRFCGTSAAAPHAAAVAVLLRQGDANATAQEVRESLLSTATPIGAFPATAVGSGLVDARSAVESLPELTAAEDGPSTVVPPVEEPVAPTAPTPPAPPPPPPPQVAPDTSLLKHPGKLVRTRSKTARAVFRFGSDQAGVTFRCKFDKGPFRACGGRIVHRFGLGPHVVKVVAVSSAGLTDATPAVFRFRVQRAS
jgi:subtilisin family serine protease